MKRALFGLTGQMGLTLELALLPIFESKKIERYMTQWWLDAVLVDSDTGFVIRVGVATTDVQKNAEANTMKMRLDYAVMKMLKKLPVE